MFLRLHSFQQLMISWILAPRNAWDRYVLLFPPPFPSEIWVILLYTCLVLAHWNYRPNLVIFLPFCQTFLAISSNDTQAIATKPWSIFHWSQTKDIHCLQSVCELWPDSQNYLTFPISFALFLNIRYEKKSVEFLYLIKNGEIRDLVFCCNCFLNKVFNRFFVTGWERIAGGFVFHGVRSQKNRRLEEQAENKFCELFETKYALTIHHIIMSSDLI